jgi:putative ABC transport system permease protein
VGTLRDSVLQGAMIIGEADFLRVFPDREGFRFFFLDAPPEAAPALVRPLEEALADWGMVVERSSDRLAAYHRVENTYLSTFQTLGILGLALGTFGLAAVVLRNVLERRRELALLRAVGYRGRALSLIIVAETVLLMAGGVACGSVCAMLAIVPALVARGGSPPIAAAVAMLAAIVAAGLLASLAAAIAVRRMPLLESLRSE